MADDTSIPGLADVVVRGAAADTRRIRVALTARVDSYDRTAGTVDVTPCTQVQVGTATGVVWADLGQLRSVRVVWPAGGGSVLTFPIAAGNLVTVLIRDTSHAEVDAGVDVYPTTPAARARWSPADAVALPGYTTDRDPLPSTATSATDVVVYMPNGVELRIGGSGAAEALALARLVKQELDAISSAFSGHTHALPPLIAGTFPVTAPPPIPPIPGAGNVANGPTYTANDVASTRAFVDS
jgi:hypothetical protein